MTRARTLPTAHDTMAELRSESKALTPSEKCVMVMFSKMYMLAIAINLLIS